MNIVRPSFLWCLIVVFGLVVFFHFTNVAQAANACISTGTGNWNTVGTWTGCGGGIPTSADSVTILTGHIVTVDTAAVADTVTINVNAAAGGNGITINSGQSLTVTGAVTLNIPTAATTDLTVGAGTLTAGSIAIPGSATANRFATVSVSTGTVTVTGSVTFSGSAARARYTSTSTSTTNIGGDFGSGGTLTTSGTGTINFNGSVAQNIGAYTTYNNLTISNTSGGVDIGGITTTVAGTTTINSTLSISSTAGTKTFGDITIATGGTMSFTAAEAITMNGSLAVNGTGTISATTTTGTWTFQKSGGSGTISGTASSLAINAGTFTTSYALNIPATIPTVTVTGTTLTNNSTLTANTALSGTGQLTQGASSVLNLGGTAAITTLVASVSTNEVHFTSTAANQTITAATYHHLFIEKSGRVGTLGGAIIVNGNLTVTAGTLADGGFQITGNGTGTFSLAASTTLTLGTVATAATATSFPTAFTTGHTTLNATSTVNYNFTPTVSGGQTISDVPAYGNLTTTATAAVTKTAAGAITVNGLLTNGANNTLADGGFIITAKDGVTNNGTHSGAGEILLSGGSAVHALSGGTSTYGNLELNDTQGATFTGTGTTTISGTFTITTGTMTANAFTTALTVSGATSISGTLTINSATGAKNFTNITVNSGGTWNSAVAEAFTINGNVQNDGTFTASTGVYTLAGATKTISGGNSITIPSVTVSGTYTNNGTLTVNTALAGVGTLTQGASSVLNLGGTSGITTLDAGVSTNEVHFTSTAANQTINSSTYHHLFIEKSGRVGTLGGAIIVNGNLTVTAGTLADGGFQITGNGTDTLALAASSTLTLGTTAAATSFPTAFTTGHTTLHATSTVNYNSNVAQTISNVQSYGNLTTTATAAVTKTAAGALTVNGLLTNGTNNTLADGGFVVTAKDGVTNNGVISGAGKLYLNGGSASHTVAGTTSTFGNVELDDSNGATWSGTGTTTVSGTLTVTTGTLSLGAFTTAITVTGATTVVTAQTLGMTSATGTHSFTDLTINTGAAMNFSVAENVAINGNLTVNGTGVISGTAGTFTFQKVGGGSIGGTASSLTITGGATFATTYSLPVTFTVNTLSVSTGITETNAGTVTANTALSGAGTFTQAAGTVLNLGGTSGITTLNAAVNANEVHYTSATTQTVKTADYYNLWLDAGTTKTMTGTVGTPTNILGNFVSTATTINWLTSFVVITGTSDISSIMFDQNNTGLVTFGGLLTMQASSSWAGLTAEACDFTFHNGMHYDGGAFVSGNGNFTFDTNNQSITGSAAVTISKVVVTGVQLTNSNTASVTVSSTLSGTGEFRQDTNAVLNIPGTSLITTLTASASGNTVNYTGAAAQTVHEGTYQTLTVDANSNGSVDITADVTANTSLILGATKLTTSSHTMAIGPGATLTRTSGFVIGSLQKNVATGAAARTFEVGTGTDYVPIDIQFGNVTVAGTLTVATTASEYPSISTAGLFSNKTVNRYWMMTNSGVSFDSYSGTFNFVSGDVDAGANTANFMVKKLDGVTWTTPTRGTVTATSIVANGMAAFSDFVIGEQPITNVSSSVSDGTYGVGQVIPIQISFADTVNVTGTPHLALNSGGTAVYASGSGTSTLVFNYTVSAGDSTTDLDYTSTSALTLNGGTIQDTTPVDVDLALFSPGETGSLGANKDIVIDGTAPASTSTASSSSDSSDSDVLPIAPSSLPPRVTVTTQPGTVVPVQFQAIPAPAAVAPAALFDILSSPLFPNLGNATIAPVVAGAFLIGSGSAWLLLILIGRRRRIERQSRVLELAGKPQRHI